MKYRRLIVALVGVTCMRLALTGQYKQYVRVGMGRYLTLAGIALAVLALADAFLHRTNGADFEQFVPVSTATKSEQKHESTLPEFHPGYLGDSHDQSLDHGGEHDHPMHDPFQHQHADGHHHNNDHGHNHSSTPKIAWLLLLPIAVAFAVVPPALGKWGIDRSSNAAIVATRRSNFLALKPSTTPLPMATNEFVARAFDENGASLKGVTVSIEGFVIERKDNYVVIGRYSIACCAADAVAAQVRVQLPVGTQNVAGAGGPQGEWLKATGILDSKRADDLPTINASALEPIRPPANTYEG